jgi:3-oxoacyl-[acyl-carrier-protein] synthase-1
MEKALRMSGLEPSGIHYINAHGTGTDNNDIAEGLAIERLFGSRIPPVSSTKPFTGHMTSAAGSAEAILSILCMEHRFLLPNLNFSTPMPELRFAPVTELCLDSEVEAVMSNSFGFGGNDTSLIFTRPS